MTRFPGMFLGTLLLCAVMTDKALAGWPEQPVKIIVPYAAGGHPDFVARMTALGLSKHTGGNFIVENKAGASGNIGMVQVVNSKADGLTFGLAVSSNLTTNALLYSKLPYQPLHDLALVMKVTSTASVLIVKAESNVATVAELVALMRREPDKHNYGNIGLGSFSHMVGEMLASKSGTKVTSILYPGAPPVIADLLRGEITFAMLPASTSIPLARAGKVRALAVTTARRLSAAPEVPTLVESGVEFVGDAWAGFVAPAGTPPAALDAFRAAVVAIFDNPEARAALAQQFVEVNLVTNPNQFRSEVVDETARFKPIIDRLNLKLD